MFDNGFVFLFFDHPEELPQILGDSNSKTSGTGENLLFLEEFMNSELRNRESEKFFEKWNSLPLNERKKQFQDLLNSPYWHFLPAEIQRRIRDQISH
jgi:hypothetical protein